MNLYQKATFDEKSTGAALYLRALGKATCGNYVCPSIGFDEMVPYKGNRK